MTITVKSKTDLVVPPSVRRRARIKAGDRVEFRVSGGIINIIPELPPADDVLKTATVVVSSLTELTVDLVASL